MSDYRHAKLPSILQNDRECNGDRDRWTILTIRTVVSPLATVAAGPLQCVGGREWFNGWRSSPAGEATRRLPIADCLLICNAASMKMTVTLTSRGVISLPARLRAALGLKADDRLIAELTPEGLLLRPAVTLPIEIYDDARIREFDEEERRLAKVLSNKKGRR